MTIEALGPKTRRPARASSAETLAIGETDSNIFDCPACARPLPDGAGRCPGCGTRLLAGVQAGRALGFVALGLIVGLMVGGGTMAALAATRLQPALPADVQTPAGAPAAPAATSLPIATAAPVVDPAIPSSALSGLRQTALVNQRVATDAGRLMAALAATDPSTADIARILRSMSSTAMVGQRIAGDVATWDEATTLSGELDAFYAAIRTTASEGLGASLRNDDAYLASAATMLGVIDGLGSLDDGARALAARGDVDLPVIILPEAVDPVAPAPSAAP